MTYICRPRLRTFCCCLVMLLAACAGPQSSGTTANVGATGTPLLTSTSGPTAGGGDSPLPSPTSLPTLTLAPDHSDLLVQLEFEPTAWLPQARHPFGRLPDFTLLEDRRVIYIEEGRAHGEERVMIAQLSAAERDELVAQLRELGFERLESHTDQCSGPVNGESSLCIADASYTVLRMRLPSGELREVRIYASFANDPAAFSASVEQLREYRHPQAEPYQPARATLFITGPDAPGAGAAPQAPAPWPLDPELLAAPEFDQRSRAIVLRDEDLKTLLDVLPRNFGHFAFSAGDRIYSIYLVPWLPAVDYTLEVEAYRGLGAPPQQLPPTQEPPPPPGGRRTPTPAALPTPAPIQTTVPPTTTTQQGSGIAGLVTLGPTCPVVREDEPCPDRPLEATIVVEDLRTGRELARTTSNADGHFRLELPAGSYRLVPLEPRPGVPPSAAPQEVTVPAGEFVEVLIQYDSGIR